MKYRANSLECTTTYCHTNAHRAIFDNVLLALVSAEAAGYPRQVVQLHVGQRAELLVELQEVAIRLEHAVPATHIEERQRAAAQNKSMLEFDTNIYLTTPFSQ